MGKGIIWIDSFEDPALDVYARLRENQLKHFDEPHGGLFIAESPMIIRRAAEAGMEPVSLLVDSGELGGEPGKIAAMFPDIPVYAADSETLKELVGFPLTRGVLSAMKRPRPTDPTEILGTSSRIAVLDRVMNPTNVGAILRSAAAMGVEAVLLTPGSCDPLYRRAARVSMGTVFLLPWAFLPGEEEGGEAEEASGKFCYTDLLREFGFTVCAFALTDDALSVDAPRLKRAEKLAVVLGSECTGLSRRVIRGSDFAVKIPMAGGVDSLNVAAASAVAFWELCRR